MALKSIIAPSMLSCDFGHLAEESSFMKSCGADWLHLDVMDMHFVPNLTIGFPVIKSLRKHSDMFFDCHLMVENPASYIDGFASAGADMFTFHYEAVDNHEEIITQIRNSGMRAGISIKPATPDSAIHHLLDLVDMVLVMTVEPGFGGQAIIQDCLDKVKSLRGIKPNLDIQVDGGIDTTTISLAAGAGANVIVAGSAIFKAADKKETIKQLRNAVDNVLNKNK
ncbi:hypothetical protein P9112_003898 [Eukaryota sp. TZLM1-RC]